MNCSPFLTRRTFIQSAAGAALLSSTPALAATPTKYVSGFPHIYEFSKSLNPNGYWWCGHAALVSALAKVGKSTTMAKLHDIFKANSPAGYATRTPKYEAKVQDLMWATGKQFGLPYSQASLNRTSAELLQKVKDAVSYNRGVIMPSNYLYTSVGHFWLIVGYKDVGDPDQSLIFMRDMAKAKVGTDWDVEVKCGSFVYNTNFNGQMPYLIVKS